MQVEVRLTPADVKVNVSMRPIIQGKLYASIKEEDSTWYLDGRLLTLWLLKSNRRGHYKDGCSNAATFWPSVLSKAMPGETLQVGCNCLHAQLSLNWTVCNSSLLFITSKVLGLAAKFSGKQGHGDVALHDKTSLLVGECNPPAQHHSAIDDRQDTEI